MEMNRQKLQFTKGNGIEESRKVKAQFNIQMARCILGIGKITIFAVRESTDTKMEMSMMENLMKATDMELEL